MLEVVLKLLNYVDSFVEYAIRINPKYVTDPTQEHFDHGRRKAFFIVHLFIMIYSVPALLTSDAQGFHQHFQAVITVILHTLALAISCRKGPILFKFYYLFMCSFYGYKLTEGGIEGIHTAYSFIHMIPLFVYISLGSYWFFLFNMVVQSVSLSYIYAPLIENAILYTDPTDFTRSLVKSSHYASIVFSFLVLITHITLHHALTCITSIEKKRSDIENQKVFLLSFSHELRNLINSVNGNIKLVTLEPLTKGVQELLTNAEVCGELLLHLVNNILDTGKVELGELEINPVPTKIYNALENIWGLSSELIKRKGLKGYMRVKNDIPETIMMDSYRLTQVLINLVGNAIKYTDNGQILVTVEWVPGVTQVTENSFEPIPYNMEDETDEGLFEKTQLFDRFNQDLITLDDLIRRIHPSDLKDSSDEIYGVLKISVSDTGCGMTKEEISQLFQKFTQMNEDPSRRKLGTGLGLFIARQICRRMGGEIHAYSRKEKGSTFMFCMPSQKLHSPNISEETNIVSMRKQIAISDLKVMLVDDISFNNTIMMKYLEKLHIVAVNISTNGLEAFEKYKQLLSLNKQPDIVTMDLEMPVMDGKTASTKIRELERERGARPCFLLIISGNCTESEIRECMNPNGHIKADGFLKKPVNLDEFVRMVGTGLEKNRFMKRGVSSLVHL